MVSEMVPLCRKVELSLNNSANKKEYLSLCHKWFDLNSECMTDTGMTNRPFFPIDLEDKIIETLGLTKEEVREAMLKSPAAKTQTYALTLSEFSMAMTLAVRTFVKLKDANGIKTSYMILAYRHYSMLHKRYWKYGAKKEIMDYTVNSLSMKNDLKRLHTLHAALEKMATNCHESYEKMLLSNDDESMFKYNINLWSRTNSFIKGLANMYFEADRKKLYLNVDETANDDEDDFKPERTSNSAIVANLARSTYMHFASTNPDDRALSIAARGNEISVGMLKGTIEALRKKGDDGVEQIIHGIIELLVTEKNDIDMKIICSKAYLPYILSIYTRSNTNDESVIKIKDNLSRILKDNCPRFQETKREATKISYRRALFIYFALLIQIHRCND
jgi:hypothetical protein